MKNLILILAVLIIYSVSINAQDRGMMPGDRGSLKKIEQLEKAKLIDLLNLDENTAIKFFARRNEFNKKQHQIFEERGDLLKSMESDLSQGKNFDEKYYKDFLSKLNDLEKRMVKEKKEFLDSLTDLLSVEQIAKFTVFEYKFRREIRESLMNRGKKSGR